MMVLALGTSFAFVFINWNYIKKHMLHMYVHVYCTLTPTCTMVSPCIFIFFINSVDLDRLASQKPADQYPHWFGLLVKYMPITETLQ